jgi:NADH:ubiquinone oxidoreductase subunit K
MPLLFFMCIELMLNAVNLLRGAFIQNAHLAAGAGRRPP